MISPSVEYAEALTIFTTICDLPYEEFPQDGKVLEIEDHARFEGIASDGEEIIYLRKATADEMVFMDPSGKLWLDAVIEDLPQEQLQLAFDRSLLQLEEEIFDPDDEEHIEAFELQLKRIAIEDVMDAFEKKGLVEKSIEPETGETLYICNI